MKEIGKEFMRGTQYEYREATGEELGLPQPPLELAAPAGAALIGLPRPEAGQGPAVDLVRLFEQRRTVRNYSPQALSLAELGFLLWATQGVKRVTTRPSTLRTVPSAGARHAFETFILANRTEGLRSGLYRYAAIEHALVEANLEAGISERLTAACRDQNQVRASAVTFAWVAVRARMYWRYGERGYRYLHLDAGHVCQNLYLAAEAIQCGVCAIAAYNDEQTNAVLGVDGVELFTIYLASVGKKLT